MYGGSHQEKDINLWDTHTCTLMAKGVKIFDLLGQTRKFINNDLARQIENFDYFRH